jgi:hypothetical protein
MIATRSILLLSNGTDRRSIALVLCIHVEDGDLRQPSGHGPISKGISVAHRTDEV